MFSQYKQVNLTDIFSGQRSGEYEFLQIIVKSRVALHQVILFLFAPCDERCFKFEEATIGIYTS